MSTDEALAIAQYLNDLCASVASQYKFSISRVFDDYQVDLSDDKECAWLIYRDFNKWFIRNANAKYDATEFSLEDEETIKDLIAGAINGLIKNGKISND